MVVRGGRKRLVLVHELRTWCVHAGAYFFGKSLERYFLLLLVLDHLLDRRRHRDAPRGIDTLTYLLRADQIVSVREARVPS